MKLFPPRGMNTLHCLPLKHSLPEKGNKLFFFLKNISIALQGSTHNQPQHFRLEPQIGKLIRSLSGNFVGFVTLKCTALTSTIPAVNLLGSQQGIKASNNGLHRQPDSPWFQTSAIHIYLMHRRLPPLEHVYQWMLVSTFWGSTLQWCLLLSMLNPQINGKPYKIPSIPIA